MNAFPAGNNNNNTNSLVLQGKGSQLARSVESLHSKVNTVCFSEKVRVALTYFPLHHRALLLLVDDAVDVGRRVDWPRP